MIDLGWIKTHRQLMEHWVWKDKPYSWGNAWIDLLLLANYKENKVAYKNEIRTFQRGTVNLSQMQLADRWGWDRRKVRRFLSLLESDNMITQESTTHGTTITLVNYDKFNGCGTTDSTTDSTADSTTEGTTDAQPIVQPAPTTKKDNKDNKVKEGKESKNIPPKSPQGEKGETACSIIESRNLSPKVEAIVKNWVAYKTERRESYKPKGLNALISEIQNNVNRCGEDEVERVVNKSMAQNYQGIVWDWIKEPAKKPGTDTDGFGW